MMWVISNSSATTATTITISSLTATAAVVRQRYNYPSNSIFNEPQGEILERTARRRLQRMSVVPTLAVDLLFELRQLQAASRESWRELLAEHTGGSVGRIAPRERLTRARTSASPRARPRGSRLGIRNYHRSPHPERSP